MGVIILGALAGFGAMQNAWTLLETCVFGRGARQGTKQASVDHASRSLARVRGDLEARRAQLVEGAVSSVSPVGREGGSWVSRVFSGADAHASLREEIAGLEALEREMSRDLEGMMARQVRAAYERTVRGRIWTGIGVGIGVYCVYRVFG
ncbi:hypothetical protein BS47DRAFT_28087 [Hydnum rufescens UP504]|uniref:Golgi pH regulator conserved domain-containing protein n=1 Tax=Hydnum rufescens UP504 TaxID=1448309 RepID=A0A9P6E1J0_9AGAM|nr:hypothetical protein BS47DRAFT_28087 [Hydnum rufescens UP504]